MNSLVSIAAPIASVVLFIAFALPSFIGVLRQRGFGRGLLILVLLVVLALGLESLMVKLRLPLQYSYSDFLGYKLLGLAPVAVAFVYPPIFLSAFWVTSKRSEGFKQILLATLLSIFGLSVVSAAFTRMNLIDWAVDGPLYNLPLLALVGWTIISLLSNVAISSIWGDDTPATRSVAFSAVGVLLFWAGVNLGLQLWISGGIGVSLAILFVVVGFIEKRRQNKDTDGKKRKTKLS